MTSALLKLPQNLSRTRKEERVEQILEELVCPCSHTHNHELQSGAMLSLCMGSWGAFPALTL